MIACWGQLTGALTCEEETVLAATMWTLWPMTSTGVGNELFIGDPNGTSPLNADVVDVRYHPNS